MVLELRDSEGATTELRVDISVDELDQNNAPVITSRAPPVKPRSVRRTATVRWRRMKMATR